MSRYTIDLIITIILSLSVMAAAIGAFDAHASEKQTPCESYANVATAIWDAADRGVSLITQLESVDRQVDGDNKQTFIRIARDVYRAHHNMRSAGQASDLIEIWDLYHTTCEEHLTTK
jgi:hypothetical protein